MAICAALLAAPAGAGAATCPGPELRTATGCTPPAELRAAVRGIVADAVAENDLRAVLLRIDRGERTLAKASPGNSMVGRPANLRMRFRAGSIAIPYLIDLLLQLEDRGRLSLDDRLSSWFPRLPGAEAVTLRMLANSTSGYPDWIQENQSFIDQYIADPFRQWTTNELLGIALRRPVACAPGDCFHYAHTNFALLSRVIRQVARRPVVELMHERVFEPLGLRGTEISARPPIPAPALHAYSALRGFYEDSTSWSPSWTIAKNTIMTTTIGDAIRGAKSMGTGALISRRAHRQRFAFSEQAGFDRDFYFGLGVLVGNGWQYQNPNLNGYTAISAYRPQQRLALALAVTDGPGAAADGSNFSEPLFRELTEYLTPRRPVLLPGG